MEYAFITAFVILAFTFWMGFANEAKRRKAIHFFVPRLNERILYLYSLTSILYIVAVDSLHYLIVYPLTHFSSDYLLAYLPWLFVLLLLTFGLMFPIYHVFVVRPKQEGEKYILILFAISAQATAGIAGGLHALYHSNGHFQAILPLWNLITGLILFILLRLNVIAAEIVDDSDANFAQIILGSAVVIVLFYLCQYVFQLYWAIGMSLCFIYVQSVNERLILLYRMMVRDGNR